MSGLLIRNQLRVLCFCFLVASFLLLTADLVAQSALGPEPVLSELPGYANTKKIRSARRALSGGGRVTATCVGHFVAVEPGHPAHYRWK